MGCGLVAIVSRAGAPPHTRLTHLRSRHACAAAAITRLDAAHTLSKPQNPEVFKKLVERLSAAIDKRMEARGQASE